MSDNVQDYGGMNAGGGGGFGDNMPKSSIGNYKGVMLCNRPNEFGQQRRPEPTGPRPFNSRVDPKNGNPVGWNPCQRIFPKSSKKKNVFQGVLNRHRSFLKNLEAQKTFEKENTFSQSIIEQTRVGKFKKQAEKQRAKIREMKDNQQFLEDDQPQMEFEEVQQAQPMEAPVKLTGDNLSQFDIKSQAKSVKSSQKSKGSKKPAWAQTAGQVEDEKEREIDNLIEFAYDLDYEKYLEDFEVRQAFAIIQDRVKEIRQDQDWKQKIAEEWNKTAEEEAEAVQQETRSVYSYKSASQRSRRSNASFASRVQDQKAKAAAKQEEWDRSTVASETKKTSVEDKVAAQIASDVLKDNSKLRGVHSNQSIKRILMAEAKRQLLAETNGGQYNPPLISKIVEQGTVNKADPSNLPYLHKCPAV